MDALFANMDITDDNRRFSSAELENSRYVLYSNLFNWDDDTLKQFTPNGNFRKN